MINPQVIIAQHSAAAQDIDEALSNLDPVRLEQMQLLGGMHRPPGGPPLHHHEGSICYLADGLAAALACIGRMEEKIASQDKRIEELEGGVFVTEGAAGGSLQTKE